MSWEVVNINSICRPRQWKTLSMEKLSSEGYPVYGANGKIGFYSEFTHEYPTLAITCRGATCGSVHITEPKSYVNGNAMALDNLSEKINIRFLYYYFLQRGFNDVISGSAQPQITGEGLSKIKVPLPPLPIQKRIAEILDAADALKRKDQQLLKKYDELAQAIFIDMFGDPVKNEKEWEEVELVNCCKNNEDIRCGPFGTQLSQSEFVKSGVPLWGIKHVNSGFKKKTNEFLAVAKAQILKNYTILKGDIVMTRKGTIGNCSVYEFENVGIMHSDLLRIRVDENIMDPYFLSFQLKHNKKIQNQIEQISQGAIMSGINVSKLKSLKILKPPIHLQSKFKQALSKIELNIIIVEKMESSVLFNSLIQNAFKAELT